MRAFKHLLRRLDDLHGMPFRQLAPKVGVPWNPKGPASNKGFAGHVVEAALGEKRNNSKKRDLRQYGLEIKTIPLGLDLKVREMTKVCALNYAQVLSADWEASHVYHKLRTTLFVPVIKRETASWADWYMWGSFIWLPREEDEADLKQDYETVRALLKAKKYDQVNAKAPPKGPCHVLVPNTGGKDSDDMQSFSVDDEAVDGKRRAWFLHKQFTQQIVDINLEYSPLV